MIERKRHPLGYSVQVKLIIILAAICCGSFVQASEKLLACLERDFLSLYAKENYSITELDIAMPEGANTRDMNRVLIALSDWDGLGLRNSHLAYVDYKNCQ